MQKAPSLTAIDESQPRRPPSTASSVERSWRGWGLSRREIGHRVSTGRLHRVHRGVYAVGHRLLAAEGRWMAAVLAFDERLVVETDGRQTHATRAAFERDRAREARLPAAGYRVVRFTYRQVTDEPDVVAGLVRSLLDEAHQRQANE